MNTSRLFELKNDLRRLQHNGHTLETVLKGYDVRQKELYAKTVLKQIFEIEETYCNAMQEISEIKLFLYPA
tara:strand:+ start:265 stop:477 length:213 start_codon:yes stop_codon:yes gene_type:complete